MFKCSNVKSNSSKFLREGINLNPFLFDFFVLFFKKTVLSIPQ